MARKIFLIFLVIKLALAESDNGIRAQFFNLPVDHFSTTDRRTWNVQFLVNENHYRENGPIFIYVEGYHAVDPQFILSGNVFDVAREQGGVLVALEHRYFGRSRPTSDASFENLQWLSVHQAVADIGRFANFMKRQYLDAPVILFGSSHGGKLALWARQKYPNVIDGTFASSAPINAILEDNDYFSNVFRTITQIGGNECGQVITDAFRMIEESFAAGNTSYIEERLMLCEPIDVGNGYDLAMLTYFIPSDIGYNFLSHARYPDIDEKCRIMRGLDTPGNPPSDPIDAFARWYIDDFHLVRGTPCMQTNYEPQIRGFQDPEWDHFSTSTGLRQRHWLYCSQVGQFRGHNNGVGHPFGTRFDTRFFRRWCADALGSDAFTEPWFMEDAIAGVNRVFGGLNPGTFRTFLTQGEMDPIRSLGPSQNLNDLSPVVVMALQSHSRDMGSINDTDYVVLQQTKRQVQEAIREWIEYARHGEPSPPPPPTPPQFVTRWFNLPLDHFSTTDRRTFEIRYLVNENHYRENGPIFIYIGSHNEIRPNLILSGNVFDVAREQGGVIIALETRYFGRSRPTSDGSFENLQWLTVHQMVADIGRFANFMKRQYLDAPVILYGSGYGGKKAIWARQKYPNVIDGAYASSAPLNAIVEDIDYFPNLFRTITQIGGSECGQVITDAFRMIEEAFEAGNTSYIEQRLNLCDPIDVGNGYDLAMLTYYIPYEMGQYFLSNARYPEIDEKCRIMRGLDTPGNPPSDPIDAFARWYIDDFHMTRETQCVQTNYQPQVRLFQDPNWNGFSLTFGLRQRFFIYCSQIGQMQVANNGQGHPFGSRFDLRFFKQWCADALGNDIFTEPWFMEDAIAGVNRIFGGLNPGTFRTFLTQGEMDPIRSLGPSQNLNDLSPVVVMALQSHSRDMGSIDDTDYVVLQQTKRQVQEAINYWIEYARYGEQPVIPTN